MSKLEEAIKKIKAEVIDKTLLKAAGVDAPRGSHWSDIDRVRQAEYLISMVESLKAKKVVADVCSGWDRAEDICAIRLYLASMMDGEITTSTKVGKSLGMDSGSMRFSYIERDAARIARAENIKYKGEELFANMPTEKEINPKIFLSIVIIIFHAI